MESMTELTRACSGRRHVRLLEEVLRVVIVTVGWRALSAANSPC